MKKIDTSAPKEIGMAAGTDGLASQPVYKGTGAKGGWSGGKVPLGACRSTSTAEMVKKLRILLEMDSGPRAEARKEEKDQRKVAKVRKTGHIAAICTKGSWNRSLNAVGEDKGDISEEVRENARTSSGKKPPARNQNHHESLQSVENNSGVLPRKVSEVKDHWVNKWATMDTGAAGHAMPTEMFPRVKLYRTSTTKKVVAANGERIKALGENTIPVGRSAQVHNIQECECCEVLDLNEKSRAHWQCRGAG